MSLRGDDPGGGKELPLAVPLVLGLFLALVLMLGHAGGRLGSPGKLVDSDCYMWLLRTERLHDGAGWYDMTSPRSNAPYGETLHWGRPFDLVLLLPALALAPFCGFHQALYLWGLAVAPMLLVPTVVLLVWALRTLLTAFQSMLACGLFLSNPAILANFYPAQPDHKCLNTLLFTAALGWSIRVLGPNYQKAHAWLLGVVFAVGMWSSVEMLLAVVILQATLAGLWIWRGGEWAARSFAVSLATAVLSSVALLLSRPPAIWPHDVEIDALSPVHLILFVLLVVAWFVQRKFGATRAGRISIVLASGAVMAGVMYGMNPAFFHGPFGEVDPEVKKIWQYKVQNTLTLSLTNATGWAVIFYLLGMVLPAVPAAAALAWRDRSSMRASWIFLAVSVAAGLVLSLFVAVRCSTQASLCALGPLAVLLAWLIPAGKLPVVARLLALMLLGSAGVAVSFLLREIEAQQQVVVKANYYSSTTVQHGILLQIPRVATRSMQELPTVELAQFLNAQFAATQRIMTHLDLSAELMYRTRHETVATPYHRNTAGILDDFHVMEATDDSVAEEILRRRGVTLILVCPTLDEAKNYYDVGTEAGTPGTLYERLLENRPPGWLKAVVLPEGLRVDFQLWEVVR